ncbi:MAG: arginine--tRNA ligase [Synergistaceae bacterium]|nr:arginine--tRNA ligase [Synergistaceae bacterium]
MKLNESLQQAIKSLGVETSNEIFERPKFEGHGDRASSAALKLAKVLKQKPLEIANKISENLHSDYIQKIEVAAPGFVNIFLNEKFYADVIKNALEQGDNYGSINLGNNKKVQVEFVSANPTGPLHIGHGRGAALGDSVARILEFTGWNVQREYYVNDSGLQIETLGRSTLARYFEILGQAEKFLFPENGYKGDYLYDIAREIINLHGEKFLNVPESESIDFFKKYAAEKIMAGIKEDLEKFRVKFDKFFPEGYLHENNLVKAAMEDLKSRGYAYEQDGALWFKTEDTIGDDKDRVLIRANGVPTYFASDIAYHRNKFITRGFERVIDVWGADHHGYIARVKAAIKAMGKNPDDFDVLLIQLVNLIRDGKNVNMSTRAGEFITLSEVLDEAGVDAARFFLLMRKSDSKIDFDMDLAKKQGNENPVYYVQYAHARICGLLREFEKNEGNASKLLDEANFAEVFTGNNNKEARELANMIAFFPDEIKSASENLAPHLITTYATSLAGAFHSFYNSGRIIDAPDRAARVKLALAARNVIKKSLELIGVNAPERM